MSTYPNSVRSAASRVLCGPWHLARLSALALLLAFAPLVEAVCGGLLILGILVSIAFKVSGAGATFPFWHMIDLSLGFGMFVILYHALIGLLSR